jgi:hypothetical protein
MKKHKPISIIIGLILLIGTGTMALAQEGKVDRATVPFSDPSVPGTVKVSLFRGGITVTGYSGREVTVEARVRGSMLQERSMKRPEGCASSAHRPRDCPSRKRTT